MPVDIESENSTAIAMSGKRTRFIATVSGDIDPETEGYIIPQGVVWEISDFGDSGSLAMGTFIDPEGVLHVDRDEQNSFVQIKATSTVNSEEYGTLDVGINEEYTPSEEPDEPVDPSDYPILTNANLNVVYLANQYFYDEEMNVSSIEMLTPIQSTENNAIINTWDMIDLVDTSEERTFDVYIQGNFSEINSLTQFSIGISPDANNPSDKSQLQHYIIRGTENNVTDQDNGGYTLQTQVTVTPIEGNIGKVIVFKFINIGVNSDAT